MTNGEADGMLIEANGWRQGSILPPLLVRTLIAEHQIPAAAVTRAGSIAGPLGRILGALKLASSRKQASEGIDADAERWMVVSQDCDLVQPDCDKEPYVELIRIQPAKGHELPQPWGKSPREMQFSDPHGGTNAPRFVCSIHERVLVDRRYLTDHEPDDTRTFEPENVKRIRHWIARRYVRASFPSEFNDRVNPAIKSLTARKSNLNKQSDLLTGIYLRVSEGELLPDEDYVILIHAAMRSDHFEDPEKNAAAQQLLDLIEAELGSCPGIEIKECELKSERDITLDLLHTWKRWDFDVLSLRPKRPSDPLPSVDEMPPEM